MSRSLIINNKKYLSSAIIAREFDYTTDYVSRLAREEKIAATQIGRQWYISEESLQRFAINAEAEKNQRNIQLRKQRQAESMMRQQRERNTPVLHTGKAQVALAQAFAVVMCGSLLGFLGMTALEENIRLSDLAHGVQKTTVLLVQAIVPNESPIDLVSNLSVLASVFTSQEVVKEEHIFIQAIENIAPEERAPQILFDSFSDEIEVFYEEDEKGVIRPVFRERETGDVYEVLIKPVRKD